MTTQLKQGAKEWHAARRKILTASNFAAAIGVNVYRSRRSLWREYKNLAPPFAGNDATRWGVENEAKVISA
jgi:uracil-DNA glycosylase